MATRSAVQCGTAFPPAAARGRWSHPFTRRGGGDFGRWPYYDPPRVGVTSVKKSTRSSIHGKVQGRATARRSAEAGRGRVGGRSAHAGEHLPGCPTVAGSRFVTPHEPWQMTTAWSKPTDGTVRRASWCRSDGSHRKTPNSRKFVGQVRTAKQLGVVEPVAVRRSAERGGRLSQRRGQCGHATCSLSISHVAAVAQVEAAPARTACTSPTPRDCRYDPARTVLASVGAGVQTRLVQSVVVSDTAPIPVAHEHAGVVGSPAPWPTSTRPCVPGQIS